LRTDERTRVEDRLARRGGLIECLRAPAALVGVATDLRRLAYDLGLFPSARLTVPVISVGNLTAGGTGKTPFVAHIVGELRRRGLRPGVLSRGYGARADGADADETRMLAHQLGDVDHVEDPDRIRGGQVLVEAGVDVIVLDDGFQHRRLGRDLDLVLIDATRPWGLPAPPEGGEPVRAFLPRGLLREGPRALGRAHAVVLSRTDQAGEVAVAALRRMVERYAPGVPILEGTHRPVGLTDPQGASVGLDALAGTEVDLVSAVGNPDAFEATVVALGARVCEHRRFPDHHAFAPGDLKGLGGGRMLLTTAKDSVKLTEGSEAFVLGVEFAVTRGEAVLEALLDALPQSVSRSERAALHEGLHG
jgi:tetraacyldisaccharide 4'-kinase